MNKCPETAMIYNKIKEDLELPDEALAVLGITKEDIDARMDVAIKSGLTRQQATDAILTIWKTTV